MPSLRLSYVAASTQYMACLSAAGVPIVLPSVQSAKGRYARCLPTCMPAPSSTGKHREPVIAHHSALVLQQGTCNAQEPPPRTSCCSRKVLAHEINVGYEGMSNLQLLAFNGHKVTSLAHLCRLADETNEQYLRFEFFPNRIIVLRAADVRDATRQICEENSLPAPRSADLVAKINGAPSTHVAQKGEQAGVEGGLRAPGDIEFGVPGIVVASSKGKAQTDPATCRTRKRIRRRGRRGSGRRGFR